MTLTDYISKVNVQYQTGNTTEHSFRGFLRDYVGTVGKCREFLNKLIDNVMEFSYI